MIRRVALALFFCALMAQPAVAQTSPTQALQSSVDQILLILEKPEYKNPKTRDPLRKEVETRIRKIFDFSEFSARTVGRNWPNFTEDQKKRFDNAFADLLLATYLDKVEGYNGEKIAYLSEVFSQKGDRAEVKTIVTLADKKAVPVDYRMMLKNDHFVVYDVIIENVSLIKNYRSQFSEVLDKGSPDALIERVESRVKELRAATK